MGKPVISIKTKEPGLGLPSIFRSKHTTHIRIEDLEYELQKIITNNMHKNEIIKNGEIYISKFFSNLGTASDTFVKFLRVNR